MHESREHWIFVYSAPNLESGFVDTMGACHSEEDHMDFILEQFSPNGACDATAGQVQKITGHVVPATAELFFAPVSGKPCVWYRTIIEEQVIHTAMTQRGVSHFNVWERLVTSEQVSDFFLKDGDSEVLVPGQSAAARFQSLCVGAKNGVWSGAPPPGVGLMVQTAIAKATGGQKSRNARWWDQSKSKNKTGKYRYTEQAFDVNELVTALGIVVKNNTGGEKEEGGGGLKMEAVTSETNVDMSTWTARAKYAWKELVKEPQILLSDHPEHYEGLTVRFLPA